MLDKILIIKFFLQGVPEVAAVLFASFALANYRAKFKELLQWAVVIALVIYLVRIISGIAGIHNLAGLLIIIWLLRRTTKIPLLLSFCIAFAVNCLLAVVELMMLKAITILLGYQPVTDDWKWIICGWPQIIIMFIVGHYIYKYFNPYYLQRFRR